VAIGSSIGHAIGGLFSGGSSSTTTSPEQQQQQLQQASYQQDSQPAAAGGACANDVRNFTRCMDEQGGNMGICGWYLEQLKACQRAAGQY